MIPTLKLPLSRTMECIDLTITDTNSNKLHPKLSSKIPIVIIESDTESENESDDSDIEFVDDGPASSTNPRSFKSSASRGIPDNFGATTLRPVKAATNCERVERLDGAGSSNHFNATSISEDERIARELQEEERRLKEAGPSGHLHTATTREDERLARELQAQDRKEYRDLISGIVNKKVLSFLIINLISVPQYSVSQEGIVFRTVINVADETLEDGSPAHPDDLERFEPWKKLFETTSLGKKVKRFHWIVNYELEKRFEEAKEALQTIPGIDPPSKELLVFHGTNPSNIDSILDNGFRIGGVGGQRVVNGTALGYGVYLATQSATSVGYALGGNRIFACRVFPGKITSDRGYSMNPPKTTNPLDEPYQTFMQGEYT
ncbi:hypothetical protein D9757_011954 [Collybiopsis confluens]|uniref:PARP catalytic domain-containing protein n=1 Tax=Collybiopsis confluens TaxID=2823264 RepID=A0A8H5G3J5_9AGAR|nr:hypothetical protein D9757_011954 [Collybiopsis confluens]